MKHLKMQHLKMQDQMSPHENTGPVGKAIKRCNLVLHFQVLHFLVLHFQRPHSGTVSSSAINRCVSM